MNLTKNNALFTILLLIVFAAFSRLIPHYPNFTAVGALALFSGAYIKKNWIGYAAPVFALFLSDLILGFHEGMIYVYAATLLIVYIGNTMLHGKVITGSVAVSSVTASVAFFVITNFGTWAAGLLYPRDITGLITCFVAAIPFFHSTLLGDLFFSGVMFGAYELFLKRYPKLALQK